MKYFKERFDKYKPIVLLILIFFCIFAYIKYKDYQSRIQELEDSIQIERNVIVNDSLRCLNDSLKLEKVKDSLIIVSYLETIDSLNNNINTLKNEVINTKQRLSHNSKKLDSTSFTHDLQFIYSALSKY